MRLNDTNKLCEDFFCWLLNLMWGINLFKLDFFESDFACIDLGDPKQRFAVQAKNG
ncbi:SMEK domain-containing protein [Neobacillus niacini]|uniref:SMEK domain-containing protein n=1 Tax=Neobacillus niacini TaxID=86668 RepID=UPI003B585D3A